jgi:cell division protein ZapA (FtsZ GTPase activity inhibitor)
LTGRRTVPVRIQGKDYRIRSDASADLVVRAAELVDETMARVRERTGTADSQAVAVLAALNIAHRLVAEREGPADGAWLTAEDFRPLIDLVEAELASGATSG